MKSKTLLLICVFLTASLFSFASFSEDSKICANPLKAICKDTKVQNTITNDTIRYLKDQIYKEAKKNAKPLIAKLDKQYTDSWYTSDKEKFRYIILNQEIMKSAKSRIKGLEKVISNVKSNLIIKSYMKLAVDESNFSEPTRKAFKKTIDSVMIGSFSDYVIKKGARDILSKKTSPCGVDGMEVNAFSTTIINQKYVLLCPGLLINFSQNTNKQESLDSFLFAVTHEIGHHVENSDAASNVFVPYISCLVDNYADQFNSSVTDKDFCQKVARNKEECKIKVTVSHAGELIADQWAIQTLTIYAREKRYSVTQTDTLLKNNYIKLCGLQDQGIHPSGAFRIESLLRNNPAVSDYLSCNNSKIKKAACTFNGTVKL